MCKLHFLFQTFNTLLTTCIFTFPPALSYFCSFPEVLQYQSAHCSILMHNIRRSSFCVVSPKIWNYLPPALQCCNCPDTRCNICFWPSVMYPNQTGKAYKFFKNNVFEYGVNSRYTEALLVKLYHQQIVFDCIDGNNTPCLKKVCKIVFVRTYDPLYYKL